MKRAHRPSSIGSVAGVFTRCCTPSNKPSSVPSPAAGDGKTPAQQTTVYLNSLELQAALNRQQTTCVRSETSQLQKKLQAQKSRLETLSEKHRLNEVLIVAQETELARVKYAAEQHNALCLPRKISELRTEVEEQAAALRDLVAKRQQELPASAPDTPRETPLDRVSELILGQVKVHEIRVSQKEQEIRMRWNRFQRDYSFLAEAKDFVGKQVREQMELHEGEVRRTLRLLRKEHARSNCEPAQHRSKKRVTRQLSM